MIHLPNYEPIGEYKKLTHEEWLALRKTGIGGSDAAGCMNMSKYNTRLSVWMDKTGRSAPVDMSGNEPVWFGNWMEDKIRMELVAPYILENLNKSVAVGAPTHMYRSKIYPFMIINVDGFLEVPFEVADEGYTVIDSELAILEIKTGNSYQLKNWGGRNGDEVPDDYYCQCQHYLAGTGLNQVWVFGVIGNQRLLRIVPRNEQFISELVEAERELWRLVELNDPLSAPAPTGSDADYRALLELADPQIDEVADISDLSDVVEDYRNMKDELQMKKEEVEIRKQRIMAAIGRCKYGETETHRVKLTKYRAKRFSQPLFRKENPDLYESYKREDENETGRLSISLK